VAQNALELSPGGLLREPGEPMEPGLNAMGLCTN